MATTTDILSDTFERVRDGVRGLVGELRDDQLTIRPDGVGNSIGWLVWHLTRVQDDHLAEIAGRDQVWVSDGWFDRFRLPFQADATGYGFDDAEVDATRVTSTALLTGYHAAVHAMTAELLAGLTAQRLDEIIDRRFDPPVTVAVRIVSVAEDCLQHLGQAAYVAGLLPTAS
jgi:uncharacterized damage-inducible protein DinB